MAESLRAATATGCGDEMGSARKKITIFWFFGIFLIRLTSGTMFTSANWPDFDFFFFLDIDPVPRQPDGWALLS